MSRADPPSLPADLSRRGALQCLAWAGAGVVWTLNGGLAAAADLAGGAPAAGTFSFVQISDSHIGFSRPANPDPAASLRETIARIRALPVRPRLILHTGDVTHLATPEQFDTAQALLSELGIPIRFVPGEHDLADGADPSAFLARFGAGAKGDGWHSFDEGGVHFVALINVLHPGDQGMGTLGEAQLAWLRDDLAAHGASTPIVVFAHFPLWGLYPQWGWGTGDGPAALALLARFGSVTVLNGHIHQVQQATEGHVVFHTARSTAYPQPAPGQGAGPGPLAVPPGQLAAFVGYSSVSVRGGAGPLAIADRSLADG